MDIMNEIIKVRKVSGMTQCKMAKAVGVSTRYWNKVEAGDGGALTLRHLRKIAEATGYNLLVLFTREWR